MLKKKFKVLPKFKNEDEEALFWETHDTTDYIDWDNAIVNPIFPNLKMSTKVITFRVTESLLGSLKMLANQKDVPYQSLMKVYLDERVREEFAKNYKTTS
jgi:predicted DNA binding CopG/RHH family protein